MALVSCQQEFKFSHTLGINSERLELEAEEGSTPVIVYSNGDWTASLKDGSEWSRLEGTSGSGIGQVKFFYDANPGLARTAVIEISSGGEVRQVKMVQKSGYGDVELAFSNKELSLPRNPASGKIPFKTNLPESEFPNISISVLTEEGQAVDWLSSLSVKSSSLAVTVAANDSGADRTAVITLSYMDAMEKDYSATLKLVQKDAVPFLNFSEESISARYSSLAATVELPFTTNLVPYLEGIAAAATSSSNWAK